jgi:hypothetical protein
MFAVKMTSNTLLMAGSVSLAGLLVACGGAKTHSGYPEGEKEPWTSATKLKLTENGEASTTGAVSYPKRERAKWYVLELPSPGGIRAKLKMDAVSTGADVALEILDSGFNVLDGPTDDNDIGQEEKIRSVKDARAGRMYFHVYTLGRTDAAEFRLRVYYDPKPTGDGTTVVADEPSGDPRASFPWTVPNLPPLPAVPAKDDAPTKGRRPPRAEPQEEPTPVVVDEAAGAKVKANIIEFATQGSGVRILVNKGSDAGVEAGWTGYVVDKSGRSLPKGAFKIKKSRNDESEGVVGLTLDQVQANRSVVLKPPQ